MCDLGEAIDVKQNIPYISIFLPLRPLADERRGILQDKIIILS